MFPAKPSSGCDLNAALKKYGMMGYLVIVSCQYSNLCRNKRTFFRFDILKQNGPYVTVLMFWERVVKIKNASAVRSRTFFETHLCELCVFDTSCDFGVMGSKIIN